MAAGALARKLKLDGAKHAAIINAPKDYIGSLRPLPKELELSTNLKGKYDWIQLFVQTETELKALMLKALKAMAPECRIWICFPKRSSRIQTDLSRDQGWGSLKEVDLKFVTLISVNDTWSAFNLRTYKPGEENRNFPGSSLPVQAVVRVPASSANLGPAFDCLALALDLWNETTFEISDSTLDINISGEGENSLPLDEINLIYRAFERAYTGTGKTLPGIKITCKQKIPLGSGLGSSAAAVLAGLLGANALADGWLSDEDILRLGAEFEGHADNLAASLHGGLVLVTSGPVGYRAQKFECAQVQAVVVLPEVQLSTQEARNALPKQVSRDVAVFNIGHSLLVLEALRSGDIHALSLAMQDGLHQPYRLPLIPGAAEALQAAQAAGAAAALSGAGPSLIAFLEPGREKVVTEAMQAPFAERGIKTRQYLLKSTYTGAQATSS